MYLWDDIRDITEVKAREINHTSFQFFENEAAPYIDAVHGVKRPYFGLQMPKDYPTLVQLRESSVSEKEVRSIIDRFNRWFGNAENIGRLGLGKLTDRNTKSSGAEIKSIKLSEPELLQNGEYGTKVIITMADQSTQEFEIVSSFENGGMGLWVALTQWYRKQRGFRYSEYEKDEDFISASVGIWDKTIKKAIAGFGAEGKEVSLDGKERSLLEKAPTELIIEVNAAFHQGAEVYGIGFRETTLIRSLNNHPDIRDLTLDFRKKDDPASSWGYEILDRDFNPGNSPNMPVYLRIRSAGQADLRAKRLITKATIVFQTFFGEYYFYPFTKARKQIHALHREGEEDYAPAIVRYAETRLTEALRDAQDLDHLYALLNIRPTTGFGAGESVKRESSLVNRNQRQRSGASRFTDDASLLAAGFGASDDRLAQPPKRSEGGGAGRLPGTDEEWIEFLELGELVSDTGILVLSFSIKARRAAANGEDWKRVSELLREGANDADAEGAQQLNDSIGRSDTRTFSEAARILRRAANEVTGLESLSRDLDQQGFGTGETVTREPSLVTREEPTPLSVHGSRATIHSLPAGFGAGVEPTLQDGDRGSLYSLVAILERDLPRLKAEGIRVIRFPVVMRTFELDLNLGNEYAEHWFKELHGKFQRRGQAYTSYEGWIVRGKDPNTITIATREGNRVPDGIIRTRDLNHGFGAGESVKRESSLVNRNQRQRSGASRFTDDASLPAAGFGADGLRKDEKDFWLLDSAGNAQELGDVFFNAGYKALKLHYKRGDLPTRELVFDAATVTEVKLDLYKIRFPKDVREIQIHFTDQLTGEELHQTFGVSPLSRDDLRKATNAIYDWQSKTDIEFLDEIALNREVEDGVYRITTEAYAEVKQKNRQGFEDFRFTHLASLRATLENLSAHVNTLIYRTGNFPARRITINPYTDISKSPVNAFIAFPGNIPGARLMLTDTFTQGHNVDKTFNVFTQSALTAWIYAIDGWQKKSGLPDLEEILLTQELNEGVLTLSATAGFGAKVAPIEKVSRSFRLALLSREIEIQPNVAHAFLEHFGGNDIEAATRAGFGIMARVAEYTVPGAFAQELRKEAVEIILPKQVIDEQMLDQAESMLRDLKNVVDIDQGAPLVLSTHWIRSEDAVNRLLGLLRPNDRVYVTNDTFPGSAALVSRLRQKHKKIVPLPSRIVSSRVLREHLADTEKIGGVLGSVIGFAEGSSFEDDVVIHVKDDRPLIVDGEDITARVHLDLVRMVRLLSQIGDAAGSALKYQLLDEIGLKNIGPGGVFEIENYHRAAFILDRLFHSMTAQTLVEQAA